MIFVNQCNTTKRVIKKKLEEYFRIMIYKIKYCNKKLKIRELLNKKLNKLIVMENNM